MTIYHSALRHFAVLAIVLMRATAAAAPQSATSTDSSNAPVLQELLREVRQLRLSLERASAVSARLQITLQRVQLQQNQANRVAGELDSVRSSLMRAESEQAQTAANLADIEGRLSQDSNRQKELQEMQREMKRALEQQIHNTQDLRTKEGELAASWQQEQSKLNEFQVRLDALEKAAELPPTQ